MRVEDRLDGADNFRSWKHKVLLILEENELLDHIKQMLPEPEEEDTKAKFRKNEVNAKRILTNSIKDHLIPNESELKTPKEMFDALTSFTLGKCAPSLVVLLLSLQLNLSLLECMPLHLPQALIQALLEMCALLSSMVAFNDSFRVTFHLP